MVLRLQANVLTRQIRRAFLKLKKDTITAQSFIRRLLVYTSFKCVKLQRANIVRDVSGINAEFGNINKKAGLYFKEGDMNDPSKELENKLKNENGGENNGNSGKFGNMNNTGGVIGKTGDLEEEELKRELGAKYAEYKPQIEKIKQKYKHANKLIQSSSPLPITFLS